MGTHPTKEYSMSHSDTPQPTGDRVFVKPSKPLREMNRAEIEEFADQLWMKMYLNMKAREKAAKAAARAAARDAARQAKADAKAAAKAAAKSQTSE